MNKYALLIFALLGSMGSVSIAQPVDPMNPASEAPPMPPTENMESEVPAEVAAPQLAPEVTDPLLEGFFEDVGYAPGDKRDPFLPYINQAQTLAQGPEAPLEPLQKFALSQLKLVGIIWDVGKPKALVVDPVGKSHIIIENTKLGQELGYVAAIREGEIIVVEQLPGPEGKKTFQTKVLKLTSANAAGSGQ